MFGKRGRKWVSTSHVLSMRPYVHVQEKHDKKDLFFKIQNMTSYPLRDLMQSQVSHINQPNLLTDPSSNTYPNMLESHDLLKP